MNSKLAVFFKLFVTNLDETTYDNYRELDDIHLQHDWQTTHTVRNANIESRLSTVGVDLSVD